MPLIWRRPARGSGTGPRRSSVRLRPQLGSRSRSVCGPNRPVTMNARPPRPRSGPRRCRASGRSGRREAHQGHRRRRPARVQAGRVEHALGVRPADVGDARRRERRVRRPAVRVRSHERRRQVEPGAARARRPDGRDRDLLGVGGCVDPDRLADGERRDAHHLDVRRPHERGRSERRARHVAGRVDAVRAPTGPTLWQSGLAASCRTVVRFWT